MFSFPCPFKDQVSQGAHDFWSHRVAGGQEPTWEAVSTQWKNDRQVKHRQFNGIFKPEIPEVGDGDLFFQCQDDAGRSRCRRLDFPTQHFKDLARDEQIAMHDRSVDRNVNLS